MNAPPIGVVLAGGKSSRMGHDKALCKIDGVRLVDCVITRLRPQVSRLLISGSDDYGTGYETVTDSVTGLHGPCAGVFSLSRRLAGETTGFLTAPVDAPYLPEDLAARLVGQTSAVAVCRGALQPTFAWWMISEIEQAARELEGEQDISLKRLAKAVSARSVSWCDPSAFYNVNTAADLEAARECPRIASGKHE